ncbi:MAG: hypothetical protein ACHWZW_13545 [Spirulina sp.]
MSSFSADLLSRDYEVKIGDYFGRGWEIFKSYAWGFILYTLIFGVIAGAFSAIGGGEGEAPIGSLIFNIISPILGAGFYIVAFQIARNRPKNFSDFFNGFKKFLPLFLTSLVSTILIALGMIALILPGIYLATSYMFAPLFVIDKNMEFWSAMETSRKLITKRWWSFFGLAILLSFLVLAGFILLGIGALVTIPLSTCVLAAAYEDIVGLNSVAEEL